MRALRIALATVMVGLLTSVAGGTATAYDCASIDDATAFERASADEVVDPRDPADAAIAGDPARTEVVEEDAGWSGLDLAVAVVLLATAVLVIGAAIRSGIRAPQASP